MLHAEMNTALHSRRMDNPIDYIVQQQKGFVYFHLIFKVKAEHFCVKYTKSAINS